MKKTRRAHTITPATGATSERSLMTDVVEIVGGADDELAASVPPV